MGMSDYYGDADETESVARVHRAINLGVNFFDTAEAYGLYTNEELLGRALKGRRGQGHCGDEIRLGPFTRRDRPHQ